MSSQLIQFKRRFHQSRARRRASVLPKNPRAVAFKPIEDASVSIALIGGRDWRYINRCLRSLQKLRSDRTSCVRVYYHPCTEAAMRMHSGVRMIAVPENLTLADLLADAASSEYLYVIDARVVPEPDTVSALLATLYHDPRVAIASSKICAPSGAISEAGRAVNEDGSIEACGTGLSPASSQFDYVRDADSVSPASFAMRLSSLHDVSENLGNFASWSYAVADLCFELRASGLRCVYQPASVAFCSEAVPDLNNLADAHMFATKWRERTRPTKSSQKAAMLFVDEHVPFDNRDAGSRRMASLLRWARDKGWHVVFGSHDRRLYERYGDRLKQDGVEVLAGFRETDLAALANRGVRLQCVWLSRPGMVTKFLPAVRATYPSAPVVYDTVDLHFLRISRQAHVENRTPSHAALERQEIHAANRSDVTVVTSGYEAELLREHGVSNVAVVGLSEPLAPAVRDFESRRGILFLGNYSHAPNVDAAQWLVGKIMPKVWQREPGITLTLAGADPVRAVKKLVGPRVRVPGFIDDLTQLFDAHRVFAAPLRFGAGLKGKIVQAMAAGIPVVTTSVGAEGIASPQLELAIADDARAFADTLVELYADSERWHTYSQRARTAVSQRFSPAAVARQFYDAVTNAKTL